MRIVIVTPTLNKGTYPANWLEAVSKIDSMDSYTVYTPGILKEPLILNKNFKVLKLPFPFLNKRTYSISLWSKFIVALKLLREKPDVVFYIAALPLPFYSQWYRPFKIITVINDIWPFVFSFRTSRKDIAMRILENINRRELLFSIKYADAISAISESTKKDLIEVCNAKAGKVKIIHHGCTREIFKPVKGHDLIREITNKYGIRDRYILYVGALALNKNLERLIEAFCLLKAEKRIKHKLIITGRAVRGAEKVFKKVSECELGKEVIFTSFVPLEELPILYSGADVFVFPSLYEGFGIPPLEAMACGTPVVTSKIPACSEVAGDAGLLVDPFNVRSIAEGIYRVITNAKLREEMRLKGLRQAREFSWEKAAKELVSLFENVCQ